MRMNDGPSDFKVCTLCTSSCRIVPVAGINTNAMIVSVDICKRRVKVLPQMQARLARRTVCIQGWTSTGSGEVSLRLVNVILRTHH